MYFYKFYKTLQLRYPYTINKGLNIVSKCLKFEILGYSVKELFRLLLIVFFVVCNINVVFCDEAKDIASDEACIVFLFTLAAWIGYQNIYNGQFIWLPKIVSVQNPSGSSVQTGATKSPPQVLTKDPENTRFIPIKGKRLDTDQDNLGDLVLISSNEKGHYSILYNTTTGKVISLKPVEQYNQILCDLFHSDRVKGFVPQDLILEVTRTKTQLSYDNIIVRDAYGRAFALRSEEFLQSEHINCILQFWAVRARRKYEADVELLYDIAQKALEEQDGI